MVVLLASGIKDGYEDVKRHQSDRAINHSKVWRLHGADWVNPNVTGPKQKTYSFAFLERLFRRNRSHEVHAHEHEEKPAPEAAPHVAVEHDDNNEPDNPRFLETSHHLDETKAHWKRILWEDIAVGDVVMLRSDDPIPADILICSTSEEENVAFVETKNLDGETNLKSRHAIPSLANIRTPSDAAGTAFSIDMEAPQPNMYQIHGAVIVDGEKQPVDGLTVLLRGTVLRNTRWCIGIVLYTGEDSKIVLNSGATPSKRSRVEREMNPQV